MSKQVLLCSNKSLADIFSQLYKSVVMSYLLRDKPILQTSKSFSTKSFQTFQESSLHCANCKSLKQQMETQITQLKDKAHQSFMQVLQLQRNHRQIQQLHDQELTIMREQFEQKQRRYNSEIDHLKTDKNRLGTELMLLQKNTKRHSCDFGAKELVIQNIDAILCEQGDTSYLDESQLIQFKDLINIRNGNDYVSNLRKQIYKDFKFVSNNKTQIQKLFILIRQLKDQNLLQQQRVQQLTRKLVLTQTQIKSARNASEASNKEIKFLTDQIKRLGNDKLKLEKRVNELERGGFNSPPNRIKNGQFQQEISRQHLSPTLQKMVILQHDKQSILEMSKDSLCSLEVSVMRREVNELNYAKFMGMEEAEGDELDHNFKKRR